MGAGEGVDEFPGAGDLPLGQVVEQGVVEVRAVDGSCRDDPSRDTITSCGVGVRDAEHGAVGDTREVAEGFLDEFGLHLASGDVEGIAGSSGEVEAVGFDGGEV